MNSLELGPVAFAACWVGIWLAHSVATAYYAIVAIVYSNLTKITVGTFLSMHQIGIGEDNYSTVSAFHAACATIHAFCVIQILIKALGSRLQPFVSLHQFFRSGPSPRIIRTVVRPGVRSCLQVAWLSTLSSFANQVFSNEGLLGVNGKWYGVILVAREFLELSLQTVQAYKMSKLLSATTPTDFYTGLLIGNCWITAWIRLHFGAHTAREHFFSLLLDCALDLVTVVDLSVFIAAPYIVNGEWRGGGFWDNVMANDERIKQSTMELQFVSVSSWSDLSSRVIFAIGLIYTLDDMKIILYSEAPKEPRGDSAIVHLQVVPKPRRFIKLPTGTSVAPFPFSPLNTLTRKKAAYHSVRNTSMFVSFVFVIWGCTLLVLHLYARSIPLYPQCSLQVQPWGARVPLCYFTNLDCYKFDLNGATEEVESMWRQFERSVIETLHILNCPSLEYHHCFEIFPILLA